MGKRGPPPKPTALKKAQGTYQKCRDHGAALVDVAVGEPPVPTGLDSVARRRWAEIVPELLRLGTLAVVDGGALEAYCRSYARWSKLEALAGKKPIVKTLYGPKVHPAGAEARKLHKEVVQPLELALGLHYAARNRVKMPEKEKPEDPVEKDLFGGAPISGAPGKATGIDVN